MYVTHTVGTAVSLQSLEQLGNSPSLQGKYASVHYLQSPPQPGHVLPIVLQYATHATIHTWGHTADTAVSLRCFNPLRPPQAESGDPNQGHNIKFILPHCICSKDVYMYKHSFLPVMLRACNALPEAAVEAATLNQFKTSLPGVMN